MALQTLTFSASSGTDLTDTAKWKALNPGTKTAKEGALASFGVSVTGDPTSATDGKLHLALVDESGVIAVEEFSLTKSTLALRQVTAGGSGAYMMTVSGPGGVRVMDLMGQGASKAAGRWYLGVTLPTGSTAMSVQVGYGQAYNPAC